MVKLSTKLYVVAMLLLASNVMAQANAARDSLLLTEFRYYDEPIQPEVYLIRPGEELRVTFLKTKLPAITLKVGPEGKIVDRNLGELELAGQSLAQARELLFPLLKNLYQADQVNISVGDPYRVAILVRGAVKAPGIYTAFSSQRVSEIIELAGGLTSLGSSRLILFSGGPVESTVDLELAYYGGDNSANPCLYVGQTVYVPEKSEAQVHLVSPLVRSFELLEADSPETLSRLAGADANRSGRQGRLLVLRDGWQDVSSVKVKSGDVLKIETDSPEATVSIFGAVNRPGRYEFTEGMLLDDLLELAGGVGDQALKNRLAIFRRLPVDEWGVMSEIRIPLTMSGSSEAEPIVLQSSDSVFIPAPLGFVKIEGSVLSPGYYPYAEGLTILAYVQYAGGFAEEADREGISLTNRVTSISSEGSAKALVGDGDIIRVKRLEILR